MYVALQQTVPATLLVARDDDADLVTRVQAEFREMPGLKLTLPQAARLFSLPTTQCAEVLDVLVRRGCLATDGKTFASAGSGRRNV